MRQCSLFLGVCLLALAGCKTQPKTDYAPLDQAGMWSSSVDQLKNLSVTDLEIAQLSKLKRVGASDDLCLALFKAARDHHHDFSNADAAIQLSQAGYSDEQILELVNQGLSNDQAEKLIASREANRNHSNTGFVRDRGRRSH